MIIQVLLPLIIDLLIKMIFNTHQLKPPFDQYLEAIFHYKHFMPDHSIERVVPTGHIFLIFELDGFVRHTYDNETLEPNNTFTKVWVSGMHKNYISISAHEDSEMFVIQFKPYGAYPFIHFPVHELNEKVVPAEGVFGQEIFDLRTQILAQETSEEKFLMAETWLTRQFDTQKTPPLALLKVLKEIQSKPDASFNTLIEQYANTQKHLIDQFKKYIGLTPKYYHRILRFNDILLKIQKKENISWAQVAYQCGYSDQSHFIREFRHFSGFNPQEFIQQDFESGENFFPLDRKG